ncbi:MAG TPA: S26 family signal peptidase [Phycisphaerae bacterium]|nr:S26 family signal peptidase [Phycisphaerae bacterium]
MPTQLKPSTPPPQQPGQAFGGSSATVDPAPQSEGIRDTIEAIIIAFILAFVFRAFVVEAFVIPTGSMAPGLYGQHVQSRCEACGYPFAWGLIEGIPLNHGRVRCPNCGWRDDARSPMARHSEPANIPESGDRILVLKWPYDIGGKTLGPHRWDVVVFKDPEDGDQNFIKRLLGLPGEVLEIIDGDIYTAPISEVRQDIREALSEPPPLNNPHGKRLTDEQEQALAKVLTIQRKTPVAQSSLWLIHYDHDYQPDPTVMHDVEACDPPVWRPREDGADSAWNASTPLVRFDPRDDQERWLDLKGKPIQDNYGYNKELDIRELSPPRNVGDVRLQFVLFPRGNEGELILSLQKGADTFRARINADGEARLERSGTMDRTGEKSIGFRELRTAKVDPLRFDRPVTIEFENVDYRVALMIDGEEVVATTDAEYTPDIGKLLRTSQNPDESRSGAHVAIGARKLPLEIRHLAVHRDVYYRSELFPKEASKRTKEISPFAGYPAWGTEHNPILLRDDPPDYFCCGDNSPQSKDGRLWWEVCPALKARQGHDRYQYGTVPGDQMIGRAFFVYWPSGIKFSAGTPAAIPNVGRMRIIR